MNDRKSQELLLLSQAERPAGAQIFGDDPKIMAQAAVKVLDFTPEFVDINMGCPAPKIANYGGGSALLKQPLLAQKIVSACVKAIALPVTVKLRTGWDDKTVNAPLIASLCEQTGASAITIHGRTRMQMYAPPIDFDTIRQVKQAVRIPVIGNGNISDGKSAADMLKRTGCDMVMVGRGALGRPWVFSQINAYLKDGTVEPEPPIEQRMEIMLRHMKMLCRYKGDYIGMKEARKHAAWYIKGIRGAAAYRQETGSLTTIRQLELLAEKVIADNRSTH